MNRNITILIFIVFFIFDIVISNTLEGRYNKILSLIYSPSSLPLVTIIYPYFLHLLFPVFHIISIRLYPEVLIRNSEYLIVGSG